MKCALWLVLVVVVVSACGDVQKVPDPDAPVVVGDFTVSVTPSPVRIVQGMTEAALVSVDRNGYAGAVTVSVSGLPAGVTADPLTIGEGADSGSLVLRSANTAVLGSSATATVSGQGGETNTSAMMQVYVQGPRGSLDTTFGGTGKVVVPLGANNDGAYGVAIMQNGTIVVVGGGTTGNHNFAGAIALKPDGMLETNMFTSGKHIGGYTPGTSTSDIFFAATVQPDGKVVAGGYAGVLGQSHYFLVARFTTLGVLDSSFGNGSTGFNVTDFDTGAADDAKAHAVAVKPDGSVLLGGFYYSTQYFSTVARYTSGGILEGRLPAAPGLTQNGVAARADGSVLAVGPNNAAMGIARYTAGDAADASFGSGTGAVTGVLRNAGSDVPFSVHNLADNRFIVGAMTKNGTNYEAAVARFTEAGALDTSFGGTGYVTTPTNSTAFDKVAATAMQADGSVILAYTLAGTTTDFAWVRVLPDGTIDPVPNVVTTDFAAGTDTATSVAIQADGRIVIAGTVAANGRNNFGVARYWP